MSSAKFTIILCFSIFHTFNVFSQSNSSENDKELAEKIFIFCRMSSVVENNSFTIYKTDSYCDYILKEKITEHHKLLLKEPNSNCGLEMDCSLYYKAKAFKEYVSYENLNSPEYTVIPSRLFFNPSGNQALFYIGIYSNKSKIFTGFYASFEIDTNGKSTALCFTYDNP